MDIKEDPAPGGSLRIPDTAAGRRLDDVLSLLLPRAGRRCRQRLIQAGVVTVDGKRQPKGYRVAPGQELRVAEREEQDNQPLEDEWRRIAVVQETEAYAAVCKPGGMHTQFQAAGSHSALEAVLPRLFSGRDAVLLNRLDRDTSGLVLAAFSPQAAEAYARMQDAGKTAKTYLALVHGRMEAETRLCWALDSAKRKKVRVLAHIDSDPLRWTTVRPLVCSEQYQVSLVQAEISKGRRHQIRAHTAAIGHPVVGDALYGSDVQGRMYLHHWRIRFPGFEAVAAPDWGASEWGIDLSAYMHFWLGPRFSGQAKGRL
jgi:23S rRNA pseudouridine1911/1915/1917 synthase